MSSAYDDIIHLPHHVSQTRPRMSAADRAAQFSPFAALTGYGAAVTEAGRLTDQRIELTESEKEALNERLLLLREQLAEQPEVTITYFQPDEKKTGGAYVSATGPVKKIDEYERAVLLCGGEKVPIDDIAEIDGGVFGVREL